MSVESFRAAVQPQPRGVRTARRRAARLSTGRILLAWANAEAGFTDHSRPGCCQGESAQVDPLSQEPAQPDPDAGSGTNFPR